MAAAKGNKYAVGANNGRPRKYDNAEDLQKECDAYFDYIKGEKEKIAHETGLSEVITERWIRHPEPPTVTGMALYLGFADKQSLYDYKKHKDFSYPIKRALSQVEMYHEQGLDNKVVTGHIFALKNSGWKDQINVETKNTHQFDDKTSEQLKDELKRIKGTKDT